MLTNSPLIDSQSRQIADSLVIVDGDLNITGTLNIKNSIIFINGGIHSKNRFDVSSSFITSTGPIILPRFSAGNSVIYSKEKIDVPDSPGFRPVPFDDPFGIKFFQFSDIGVAVKPHARGAEITALSPFSPLKLFGLRVGDVVTKVDDRAIDSPDALRRASRTAYVREAGVYYLLRNGQALDRIVLFGDYQLP